MWKYTNPSSKIETDLKKLYCNRKGDIDYVAKLTNRKNKTLFSYREFEKTIILF